MGQPQLRLPDDRRAELKDPLGEIETDVAAVLEAAGEPIVAVGDVVTHHLRQAGRPPDVAVVDGMTERSPVEESISETVERDVTHRVENPAATITAAMVRALEQALEDPAPSTILVEGEEDLAALPAVLLVPFGGTVVYGQPGEGMVVVPVDEGVQTRVRELLSGFEGDQEAFATLTG